MLFNNVYMYVFILHTVTNNSFFFLGSSSSWLANKLLKKLTTNLQKPMLNTSLHGAITSLSPIKKGWKSLFSDGMLTDDTSKGWVVGFETHQQKTNSTRRTSQFSWSIVKLDTVRVTKFCSKAALRSRSLWKSQTFQVWRTMLLTLPSHFPLKSYKLSTIMQLIAKNTNENTKHSTYKWLRRYQKWAEEWEVQTLTVASIWIA